MVTPKYNLPELISGSLTMQAYNDRLAFLETLMTEIEATGIYDQQDIAQLVNNKIQIISNTPTVAANNWYQGKSNGLHLQVENITKFLTSFAKLATKVRYKNCKLFAGSYLLHPTSNQTITYTNSTSTTTNTTLCKYNYLSNATVNNYCVLQVDPIVNGIAYVVNTGTATTYLCLNNSSGNGGFCTSIGAGKIKQVIAKNGVITLYVPPTPPPTPVALWTMNEALGQHLQNSANSNVLQFTSFAGSTGQSVVDRFGNLGRRSPSALNSNRFDLYSLPPSFNFGGTFTLICWIRVVAYNNGFILRQASFGNHPQFFIRLNTTGLIVESQISDSSGTAVRMGGNLPLVSTNSIWHFLSITHNHVTKKFDMKLNLNNPPYTTSYTAGANPYSFSSEPITNLPITMFGDPLSTSNSQVATADIDHLRLFNTELSLAELTYFFNEN